jgi:hypothetical protein
MDRACNTNKNNRKAYTLLVGKAERKILLGRLRHQWVDNIKMDLGQTEWGRIDWIYLNQGREQ